MVGEGDLNTRLMLIALSPGENEDEDREGGIFLLPHPASLLYSPSYKEQTVRKYRKITDLFP